MTGVLILSFTGCGGSSAPPAPRPTLTVTATDASRVYGTANPAFTASASGALPGDTFTFTASTAATSSSAAGTYPIVPTVTGANLANYNVVYVNGALTVNKAVLTVTAADASRAYGVPNPAFTASASGTLLGDAFTFTASTVATPSSPVGTYSIVPLATGANLANYNVVYFYGSLSVNKAVLTVTAADASRLYGAPNPAFTASASGALPGDITFTGSTVATPSSPVGTYSIVPLATGANLANYNVLYVNGTLTVNKDVLTVTPNNQSIFLGYVLPTLSATITGLVNGDAQTVVAGLPALTTTATSFSLPGTYPIVATIGTLAAANYSFTFGTGTFTVMPANNSGVGFTGTAKTGPQPIMGASVQLYAAGTTGNGSAGTALLSGTLTTDSAGVFTVPDGYPCPAATSQLYVIIRGGQVGSAAPRTPPLPWQRQ